MSAGPRQKFRSNPVVHPPSSRRKPASLGFQFLLACALPFATATLLAAQDVPVQEPPLGPPAVVELMLPPGATATADGNPLDDPRAITIGDLKLGEYRRVKVVVKFADGAETERPIDVTSGQRLRIAVPRPGPEPATVIAMQTLVPIYSVAVNRGGRYIALGLDDRAVVLWDTIAGRPVRTLAGHQTAVQAIAFNPAGNRLVSGSTDGAVILWDIEAGTPLRTYKGHTAAVASVAFSPDGERFVTGSADTTAIHWETQTGLRLHTVKMSKGILGVAYSPDGATLGTSSADFTSARWDAQTGTQKFALRGHREDVNCIAFSPDGKRVITGSSEDQSIIWDVAAGRRLLTGGRHTNNIHSVAFTPDGQRFISGEREELVRMWEAANGRAIWTFVGHNAEILSIVPSPDGRTMLTGSKDGTARLWDLTTGRELLTLTTDGERKTWAVASADGLFDASEPGRRALGFRFPKLPGGEIDQFFAEAYRPGLLAEVWRGERPLPVAPLGRAKPPVVKLAAPMDDGSNAPRATFTADVVDQGSGVGAFVVVNNGVPLAVPTKAERAPNGPATRVTFTVPLVPGPNKIRLRTGDREGAQESHPSEVELTYPRTAGQRGRMYVVAVGVSDYAEKGLNLNYPTKDAQALAELLRSRGAKMFDRVDVVPVFDRDATRMTIQDTVADVAELTRPQDTLVVVLCGHGAGVGDRMSFAPHDLRVGNGRRDEGILTGGLALDNVAALMGTARALKRVLIVDTAAASDARSDGPDFGLRGGLERLARAHGVYAIAATPTRERPELGHGRLTNALLATVNGLSKGSRSVQVLEPSDPSGAVDVAEWFDFAAQQARLAGTFADVQSSTQAQGFPILAVKRK